MRNTDVLCAGEWIFYIFLPQLNFFAIVVYILAAPGCIQYGNVLIVELFESQFRVWGFGMAAAVRSPVAIEVLGASNGDSHLELSHLSSDCVQIGYVLV